MWNETQCRICWILTGSYSWSAGSDWHFHKYFFQLCMLYPIIKTALNRQTDSGKSEENLKGEGGFRTWGIEAAKQEQRE